MANSRLDKRVLEIAQVISGLVSKNELIYEEIMKRNDSIKTIKNIKTKLQMNIDVKQKRKRHLQEEITSLEAALEKKKLKLAEVEEEIIEEQNDSKYMGEKLDLIERKSINLMQIFVRNLTGKTIAIEVHHSYTITQVKDIIYEKEGIPQDIQKLYCGGRHLRDGKTLVDLQIDKHSTLNMIIGFGPKPMCKPLS